MTMNVVLCAELMDPILLLQVKVFSVHNVHAKMGNLHHTDAALKAKLYTYALTINHQGAQFLAVNKYVSGIKVGLEKQPPQLDQPAQDIIQSTPNNAVQTIIMHIVPALFKIHLI